MSTTEVKWQRIENPLEIIDYLSREQSRFTLVGQYSRYAFRTRSSDDGKFRFVALVDQAGYDLYLGYIKTYGKPEPEKWDYVFGGDKARIAADAPAARAFAWFWRHLKLAQGLNPHKLDRLQFYGAA